jgi:hypothetical protein
MTSGGHRHVPAALSLGERAGIHCTGGWVGPRVAPYGYEKKKIFFAPPGFEPRVVQYVASRCTDCAVPFPCLKLKGRVNSGLKCGGNVEGSSPSPSLRFCPGIGMQGLRKIARGFDQVTLLLVQDLNPKLLQYETRVRQTFRHS